MQDEVPKMLACSFLEAEQYYLVDVGIFEQEPEDGNKPVDRPILVVSRFESTENLLYDHLPPGNPRWDRNFRILDVNVEFNENTPSRIGTYSGSTYFDLDEQLREGFRNFRRLYLPYESSDGLLDRARDEIEMA